MRAAGEGVVAGEADVAVAQRQAGKVGQALAGAHVLVVHAGGAGERQVLALDQIAQFQHAGGDRGGAVVDAAAAEADGGGGDVHRVRAAGEGIVAGEAEVAVAQRQAGKVGETLAGAGVLIGHRGDARKRQVLSLEDVTQRQKARGHLGTAVVGARAAEIDRARVDGQGAAAVVHVIVSVSAVGQVEHVGRLAGIGIGAGVGGLADVPAPGESDGVGAGAVEAHAVEGWVGVAVGLAGVGVRQPHMIVVDAVVQGAQHHVAAVVAVARLAPGVGEVPAAVDEGEGILHLGGGQAGAAGTGRLAGALGVPVAAAGGTVIATDQPAHLKGKGGGYTAGGVGVGDAAGVDANQATDIVLPAADAAGGIGIGDAALVAIANQATDKVAAADVAGRVGSGDAAGVVFADQTTDEFDAADAAAGVDV